MRADSLSQAGSMTVAGERLVFYRYQRRQRCGVGYLPSQGAGGRLEGPCNASSITNPGFAMIDLADGRSMVIIWGAVNAPGVKTVTITMKDGSKVPAEVGDGVYFTAYVVRRGSRLPEFADVRGYDKNGKDVQD